MKFKFPKILKIIGIHIIIGYFEGTLLDSEFCFLSYVLLTLSLLYCKNTLTVHFSQILGLYLSINWLMFPKNIDISLFIGIPLTYLVLLLQFCEFLIFTVLIKYGTCNKKILFLISLLISSIPGHFDLLPIGDIHLSPLYSLEIFSDFIALFGSKNIGVLIFAFSFSIHNSIDKNSVSKIYVKLLIMISIVFFLPYQLNGLLSKESIDQELRTQLVNLNNNSIKNQFLIDHKNSLLDILKIKLNEKLRSDDYTLDSLVIAPDSLSEDMNNLDIKFFKEFSFRNRVAIIFGIYRKLEDNGKIANSTLCFNCSELDFEIYDKQILFPYTESRSQWIDNIAGVNKKNFVVPGENKNTIFNVENISIIPTICVELFHPKYINKRIVTNNPYRLILNHAGDSWFDTPLYKRIILGMVKARALENGVSVLRISKNGDSLFVQPDGDIVNIANQDPNKINEIRLDIKSSPNTLGYLNKLVLISLLYVLLLFII